MARTETTRDTAAEVRALVHAKRPKAWALAPSLPVLISPKGYRVEGLDVVALAALLAVVG